MRNSWPYNSFTLQLGLVISRRKWCGTHEDSGQNLVRISVKEQNIIRLSINYDGKLFKGKIMLGCKRSKQKNNWVIRLYSTEITSNLIYSDTIPLYKMLTYVQSDFLCSIVNTFAFKSLLFLFTIMNVKKQIHNSIMCMWVFPICSTSYSDKILQ